jgi:O-antigen ligase
MRKETLLKIIRWGVYVCLALPLFLTSKFFYPFIFPRTALFRLIIEVLFVFYILLIIKFPEYRPKRNLFFWSMAAFTLILILTTITSVDPSKSFYGTMERGSGVFSWLHYFAFFIILISVFKYEKDWTQLFSVSIGVSLIVSLYALGQRIGLPSLIESGVDRATGTIGNAAFLASYLVLNIGLAIILIFKTFKQEGFSRAQQALSFSGTGYKILYWLALVFNLIALYLTLTRGAVLGVIAGFGFFVLFFLFKPPEEGMNLFQDLWRNKAKRYLVISLLAVVIFFSFIIIFRGQPFIKNNEGLARLSNISLTETTARTRILAWQSAWQGWKEKFWLGWGPDNFNIVFNKYFNPEFYRFGRSETWFDRAHNIIFDIGTTSGIVGLFTYLSIFTAALFSIWQKRRKNFLAAAALSSTLVAYFTQNLLVFDIFNSYLVFALLLAYIYFFTEKSPVATDEREQAQQKGRKEKSLSGLSKTGIGVLFLFAALIGWQLNAKPLFAAYWTAESYRAANKPESLKALADKDKAQAAYDKVIDSYKKTFSYQVYGNPELRVEFSSFIVGHTENERVSFDSRLKAFQFAMEQIMESKEMHPLNAQWYLFAAKITQSYAQLKYLRQQNNKDLLDETEKIIRQGINLSQKKVALYYILIQTLIMEEKYEEALKVSQFIIPMADRMPDSHWYFGITQLAMKDETSAKRTIDQAFDLGYAFQNKEDASLAATLYGHFEDYSRLANIYQQLIRLEPRNTQWYASLATVYSKLGEKEKAKETARKILDIDPFADQQVEQFIRGL